MKFFMLCPVQSAVKSLCCYLTIYPTWCVGCSHVWIKSFGLRVNLQSSFVACICCGVDVPAAYSLLSRPQGCDLLTDSCKHMPRGMSTCMHTC